MIDSVQAGPAAQAVAQLRCFGCGAVQLRAAPDFRCPDCGELLEVVYPAWPEGARPQELKRVWLERKTSPTALDRSGVWRFRELIPIVSGEHVVTIGEGNTPLYE